ncbi:MAG TPA: RNA polymerase sigma factor [Gemmatimonadaceae bacterium]
MPSMRPDGRDDLRTDGELLSCAARGDEAAVHALVSRHIRAATLLAAQLLGDRDEAEDVVQDAFIVVLRRADDFDAGAAFAPWLFGVVKRLAVKSRTRATRRWRLLMRWRHAETPVTRPRAEANLEVEEVRTIIGSMPPMQRACCELTFIHGFTVDEIAAMHDVAPATVRQHVFRGRQRLRSKMSAEPVKERDR